MKFLGLVLILLLGVVAIPFGLAGALLMVVFIGFMMVFTIVMGLLGLMAAVVAETLL